jgi:hypothetical protein
MATTKKDNVLFTIDGFEVRRDSTYQILNKRDGDAPSGFLKAGVTKLPSDGVGDTFSCKYVRRPGSKEGVWDTGFYSYSPCYSGKSKEEIEVIVDRLTEVIVRPIEQIVGEGKLAHTNNQFWDSKRFFITSGMILNTENPEDVLKLYFSLMTNNLTPKGSEGDSAYSNSSYIVQDTSKVKKLKDERAENKFKAIGVFHALIENDPAKLGMILNYLGLNYSESVENSTLMAMFDEYISSGEDRLISFNSAVEESKTKPGMDKIAVYSCLKNELRKPKSRVEKTSQGVLFFEDTEIGADIRSAAENIAKNSKLKEVKTKLLLED